MKEKGQRPCRMTGRTGCTAFIYLSVSKRLPGQPWVVRGYDFKHNHPISADVRTYHVNRKLNAEDQEFAINMMCSGSTPKETLKVSRMGLIGILCLKGDG